MASGQGAPAAEGPFCFDVVLVGDLRVPGGTSRQLANEVRALHGAGYRVGLVGVELPHARGRKPIDPLISARLAAGEATLLHERLDEISAGLVIFENPRAFMSPPPAPLKIAAKHALIALHFPYLDGTGKPTFDPERVQRVCAEITDAPLRWAPTSALTAHILREARPELALMDGILPCIVYAAEFATTRDRARRAKPVIGRHARPHPDKWPADRKTLLQAYPDSARVSVSLMGLDPALRDKLRRLPANWRVHEFNQVEPREFLAGIDFFVCFHHPHWIEAFGLATAEAMASGAVALLPEYMRANFGDAALYCRPEEVSARVAALHRDRAAYLAQSRKGAAFIRRRHSPAAWLAAIAPLLSRRKARPRLQRFDIVSVADMRRAGNEALRVANEATAQAEAGYRCGLLHAPGKSKQGRVRPELDLLVRNGLAGIVDPALPAQARLLLAYGIEAFLSGATLQLRAARVIVVVAGPVEREQVALCERVMRAEYGKHGAWAATSDEARAFLEEAGAGARLLPGLWRPVAKPRRGGKHVPGRTLAVVETPMPDAGRMRKLAEVLPVDGSTRVRLFGAPTDRAMKQQPLPRGWQTFKSFEIAPVKVLDGADALYCPGPGMDAALAEAMARGLPILASPALRRQLGDAAMYCRAEEVRAALARLYKSPALAADYSRRAHARAAERHAPPRHVERIQAFLQRPLPPPAPAAPARSRVLMFAQNGVGLGHVVRLLAIARHLSASHDIVFCSMSQAYDIISRYGYQVEHLPSHVYSGVDYADWQGWAREQLEQMIDFHDVGAVVLDGSVPYAGVLDAVASRPDVRSIWLRRPMWRPGRESNLRLLQQKFFDLVVEPEEIAAELDTGPTVEHRRYCLAVPPVRLFDRREMPSREAAARALGLDPSRPSLLVQLGSGTNRDVVALIDRIVAAARRHDELQVVVAEWRNANDRLDLWPGVRCLQGFPYARYFNAFDFSFSAAGYNSFHEIMAYRLPTAFIVNPREYMDGQGARAQFAAERGAAITCEETPAAIAAALARLWQADERAAMRAAMARFDRPNGAARAARAIAAMMAQA